MVQDLPTNLVGVIVYLLPGFVAAWLFYGLTSHPKPSQFERIIQALIFTFIVRVLVEPIKVTLILTGKILNISVPWGAAAEQITSLVLAVVLGVLLAYATNTDALHKWLRKFRFTTRTSHPSEWFYIFSEKVMFVVLQMKDGRRLFGWPKEWPIEPGKGQFYIMMPAWIDEDGKQIDLPELDGILVQASDVQWVEFVKDRGSNNE